ncbi:GntR family transcriptional regulator [Desertihabitans brevis]|uniref:GntR family transcriptional regulator n=1 Tax=Desertihabitans brevis TaxID=2268447 RepID=A0A367YQ32_9ACTN|nr:GntR family transcriptional regulator [Desertihabitans brevis]
MIRGSRRPDDRPARCSSRRADDVVASSNRVARPAHDGGGVRVPHYGSPRQPRGPGRQRALQWVLDLLRTELISGVYADDTLPSEDHLVRRYGVSRGVVRQALLILREQGVVERVRGAGTFSLTPGLLKHGIDESRDLVQDVNATGTRIAVRTVYAQLHPAAPFIATKLETVPGAAVVILEQLASLDGYPLSLRTSFLPATCFGELVTDTSINLHRSPYQLIEELIGSAVGDTELEISTSAADPVVGEWLDLPVGAPVLDTRRVVRAGSGEALEYSMSHARSDRIVFSTVMRGRGAHPSPAPAAAHVEHGFDGLVALVAPGLPDDDHDQRDRHEQGQDQTDGPGDLSRRDRDAGPHGAQGEPEVPGEPGR